MSNVKVLDFNDIDTCPVDNLLVEELIYLFNSKIINRLVNNPNISSLNLKYPNIYFKINICRYNEYVISLFRNRIEEKYKIIEEYLEDNNYFFVIVL